MTDITPLHPNRRDSKQVETLSGLGASLQYIATHLSLTLEDLQRHYQKELDYGREHANLEVAETFFDLARSGEYPQITAQWMKMRAGWTEAKLPDTLTDEDDESLSQAKDKLLTLLNRAHKA